MAKLVSAVTPDSCGLACIESIVADNGRLTTQSEMIAELGHLFPEWTETPGIMSINDFEIVFRAIGFPVTRTLPATCQQAASHLADVDVVGAIFFVKRFWQDPTNRLALCDRYHVFRFLGADRSGIEVMNPYCCPLPAQIEHYSWQEVQIFQGRTAVFEK
jgi:hypothetical protein